MFENITELGKAAGVRPVQIFSNNMSIYNPQLNEQPSTITSKFLTHQQRSS